jgi:hypothetical protein
MTAITNFTPSPNALGMVATARQDAGATNAVSEGAVLLAEFLCDRHEHPLVDFLGGWGGVSRLLADGYMPGNDIGEEMGRLTKGILTPQMWRRPWDGEIDPPAPVFDEAFQERLGASALAAPSLGALGTTPPGPLFRFVAVEDEPNLRQIVGLGLAIELPEPALCALRDAAVAALADLRRGAQA